MRSTAGDASFSLCASNGAQNAFFCGRWDICLGWRDCTLKRGEHQQMGFPLYSWGPEDRWRRISNIWLPQWWCMRWFLMKRPMVCSMDGISCSTRWRLSQKSHDDGKMGLKIRQPRYWYTKYFSRCMTQRRCSLLVTLVRVHILRNEEYCWRCLFFSLRLQRCPECVFLRKVRHLSWIPQLLFWAYPGSKITCMGSPDLDQAGTSTLLIRVIC